jgi:hypothetical protein
MPVYVAALAACSALPADGDGVVALEIRTQAPVSLEQGVPFQLRARALDQSGDSIPALIRWRTGDTAAVFLDSLTGIVEGRLSTGTAQVQAVVGTLRSNPLTLTLLPPPASNLRMP